MIDKPKNFIVRGRTVYFVHRETGEIRPAIITDELPGVPAGEVEAVVFDYEPGNLLMKLRARYSAAREKGTWHWPDGHECEETPDA
jgi:hypothetical protein